MPAEPAALTVALRQLEAVVLAGFGNLQGDIYGVFNRLMMFSFLVTLVFWMLDGRSASHAKLIGRVFQFVAIGWLLENFQGIAEIILNAMIGTGLQAGGSQMSSTDFRDPGRIAEMGLVAMQPIRDHMDTLLGPIDFFWYLPELIIYGIVLLLVLVGFVILAWQVFFALLEYLILSLAAFVCVPWAVFNKTSFIAERAMGYIVATGIKMLVLALVLSIVEATLLAIEWSDDPSVKEALGVAALAGAGFLMALWAPRKAAGLINGGPVLDATMALLTLGAAARLSGNIARAVGGVAAGAAKMAAQWSAGAGSVGGRRGSPASINTDGMAPPSRGATGGRGGYTPGGGGNGADRVARGTSSAPEWMGYGPGGLGNDIGAMNAGQAATTIANRARMTPAGGGAPSAQQAGDAAMLGVDISGMSANQAERAIGATSAWYTNYRDTGGKGGVPGAEAQANGYVGEAAMLAPDSGSQGVENTVQPPPVYEPPAPEPSGGTTADAGAETMRDQVSMTEWAGEGPGGLGRDIAGMSSNRAEEVIIGRAYRTPPDGGTPSAEERRAALQAGVTAVPGTFGEGLTRGQLARAVEARRGWYRAYNSRGRADAAE